MIRYSFMLSASMLALGAGEACAQRNGEAIEPQSGNRVVVSCTPASGNDCKVDQGAAGESSNSTASVGVDGSNGTSSIFQRGDRQYGDAGSSGAYNFARINQGSGSGNSATIRQTGTRTSDGEYANNAQIDQGNQSGVSANQAAIVQVRDAGGAGEAKENSSYISQAVDFSGGINNRATSTQNGRGLTSIIRQSDIESVAPSNNSATVLQTGRGGVVSTGTNSSVSQKKNGNIANVSLYDGGVGAASNNSRVTQDNFIFVTGSNGAPFTRAPRQQDITSDNSPATQNVVTVAIIGTGNDSFVDQSGVQNTADVSILSGGAGNTTEANGAINPGTGASLATGSGGQPIDRQFGNESTITQRGRGNYAAVSLGGRARYSNGKLSDGTGNISRIEQSQGEASIAAATLTSSQSPTTAHRALIYQRGALDAVAIIQNNNKLSGSSASADGTIRSGAVASVSQLSFNGSTTIEQSGTNYAWVDQGSNRESTSADGYILVRQIDAGEAASSTSGNTVLVGQNGIQNSGTILQAAVSASATLFQAIGTRANTAGIRQGGGGVFGGTSSQQNAANAAEANFAPRMQNVTASVNQTAGQAGTGTVTNAAGLTQDRGAFIIQNGRSLFAIANQAGGTTTPAGSSTGGASSNNSILIAQANDRNSATVSQNGTNLIATVEQRGGAAQTDAGPIVDGAPTATAATSSGFINRVTITQSNDNNRALARQTVGVGNSDQTGATAGVVGDASFPNSRSGANSAEIVITQSGTGGSATVEQRGRGQYASIAQSGADNVGGILQLNSATNAVALLSQMGTGNIFYVTQDAAGQYINVRQTGTANSASAETFVTDGPDGSGNSGSTATPITFGRRN